VGWGKECKNRVSQLAAEVENCTVASDFEVPLDCKVVTVQLTLRSHRVALLLSRGWQVLPRRTGQLATYRSPASAICT